MSITNAVLAQQITDLVAYWRTRDVEYADWVSGTATGGPYGDGRFPLTGHNGTVYYVKCPAALAAGVDGSASAAAASASAAGASADASHTAQLAAEAAALLALEYRDAALAARDLAESYKNYAAASEANAAASAAAAAAAVGDGISPSSTHTELLTDGLGNFIFAGGDCVTVLGVPNS